MLLPAFCPSPCLRTPQKHHPPHHLVCMHSEQPQSRTRRTAIQALAAMSLGPLLLPCNATSALQSGEIHAELSDLASKLPGAGMPDVFYPSFFEGDWLVSRDLYAVETLGELPDAPGHSVLSARALEQIRNRIGLRESFNARFISHRNKIIEDRLYNTQGELASVANKVKVQWNPNDPNVLTAEWGVGRLREVKVTKRAFVDGPQGYGTFVSSEYARVVDVEGEGSRIGFGKPPSIYGRRRLVRYKVSAVTDKIEPDGMDRIVVDYIYAPSQVSGKPSVVIKFRDFLNRKHGIELVGG